MGMAAAAATSAAINTVRIIAGESLICDPDVTAQIWNFQIIFWRFLFFEFSEFSTGLFCRFLSS